MIRCCQCKAKTISSSPGPYCRYSILWTCACPNQTSKMLFLQSHMRLHIQNNFHFFGLLTSCLSWLNHFCCLYFSTNFLVTFSLSASCFPLLSLCLSLYSDFFSCRIACMSLLCCSIPSVTTNSSLTLPSFSSSTRKICLLKRSRNLPWASVSLNTQVRSLSLLYLVDTFIQSNLKMRQYLIFCQRINEILYQVIASRKNIETRVELWKVRCLQVW